MAHTSWSLIERQPIIDVMVSKGPLGHVQSQFITPRQSLSGNKGRAPACNLQGQYRPPSHISSGASDEGSDGEWSVIRWYPLIKV